MIGRPMAAYREQMGAVTRRGRLCLAAFLALGVLTAASRRAGAQTTSGPRTVSGRIVRPTADSLVPVPGIRVTIHRVGADTAAPLDSTRTSQSGHYFIRYRPFGDPNAIYFLSVSYDGIAYFSQPLTTPTVSGPEAEITVFDTTSAPIPLHVRGRHIVVASPRADGTREMMEVFELSNDTSVTRVSPDDAHPTFTAVLPDGITEFQPGQSDISPQAIRYVDGKVAIVAPIAPGLKQFSVSFRAPASTFPLSIPVQQGATVLEVLVEEPSAQVSGARLEKVANVAVEGRTFNRYLAQDVPANAVLRIQVPEITPPMKPIYFAGIAIAIGAAMLVALAMSFGRRAQRRPAAAAAAVAPAGDDPAQIARAIAQLDGAFERRTDPSAEDRAAYERTRAALKQRLAATLAERRHAE